MPGGESLYMTTIASNLDHQESRSLFVTTKASPILNTALSSVSPSLLEGMSYMKPLPCTDQQQVICGDARGKRKSDRSSIKHGQAEGRIISHGKSMLDFFVEDAQIYHREVKKPAKEMHTATRLFHNGVAHWNKQPPYSLYMQECSERGSIKKQTNFTEKAATIILPRWTWSGILETTHNMHAATLPSGCNGSGFDFLNMKKAHLLAKDGEKRLKTHPYEFLKGEMNGKPDTQETLVAFPFYDQMPKFLPTCLTGEPSVPPASLVGRMMISGKDLVSSEAKYADWGKFLALSAAAAGSVLEKTSSYLPYQYRFQHLQAFLKQCDELDQRDHFQGLRSMSIAAISSCATELEARAIRLSLEEGKEMKRMEMLNVLGETAKWKPK